MIRGRCGGACGHMTEPQPETPIPAPEPSPPPPIGDPPPDGPEVPVMVSERDLGGPADTGAGTGDGTEGPDAPDEPGPRPPGFPDPSGGNEDGGEKQS
jgi:hypothetical protein